MRVFESAKSSLGRWLFDSEISYNKAPPPACASLLNKPKSQKSLGHWIPKRVWTMNFKKFMHHEFPKFHGPWIWKISWTLIFKNSWTMISKNSRTMILKNLRKYVLIFKDFVLFFDKKLGKPLHSWENIYFSYSKYNILQWWIIAQRENYEEK